MQDDFRIREKILTGARDQFQQFGLKKTTMDDIAKSIGMGKSSIYYYFKSKDEIFDQVLDDELLKLRYVVDQAVRNENSLPEKMIAYASTYFKELIPRQTLYRIVNQEDNAIGSKTRLKKIIKVEVDYLTSLIREESAVEFPIPEDKVQFFAETIVSSIYGVIHYSFVINDDMNEDKFNSMMQMIMPRLV